MTTMKNSIKTVTDKSSKVFGYFLLLCCLFMFLTVATGWNSAQGAISTDYLDELHQEANQLRSINTSLYEQIEINNFKIESLSAQYKAVEAELGL